MNRDEVKEQLNQLHELKQKAIQIHGYGFCDTPLYDEILEKENQLLTELMKPEPSKVTEEMFKSRW